jgi:D-arginine dehydrogenase
MTSNTPTPVAADFLVIGGGIAGASAAHWLAPHARVILLERESQPGYHSTGRSAALFMESYGTPQVRALTMASRAFLEHPPEGFSEHPLLTPRGAMMVAGEDHMAELEAHWEVLRAMDTGAARLSGEQAREMVPALRPEQVLGAVYEPDAADMDVHAIHQGYLRGMRRAGGKLVCDAEVTAIERVGERWRVTAGGAVYEAPVVLNAAGAWVDTIARLAGVRRIGIEPRRRSAFIFAPPEGQSVAHWPMVFGADEGWYIKPDAGMLLGSPANADPVEPQDVQPEEMDIAIAITASRRRPRSPSAAPRAPGPACAPSWPTATWSAASSPVRPASSGWRRKAATASRPRPPWARPAPRWHAACRCPSASPPSA